MYCYVCGHNEFGFKKVLWDRLIDEWQLNDREVEYIDRQQGYYCKSCGSNLRSIALSKALVTSYGFNGTLVEFVDSDIAQNLKILEINQAGSLTSILQNLKGHLLINYPAFNMTKLSLNSSTYDLVLHSDTLEHVENVDAALSECRRILSNGGRCIFTVPLIVDRLTRSRHGLSKSYHGMQGQQLEDHVVHYEFGMDIWKFIIKAGFSKITFHCVEYPSGIALEAGV